MASLTPQARRRQLEQARDVFNAGEYWLAHEALETVWRSIIDDGERRVWQGLIQAAAALLHRRRGNRHGTVVVGAAALERLSGPQHPAVEFDTLQFRAALARALVGEGDPPRLDFRSDA
jgi:predicted metal-dependent hydrolase